MAESDKNEIFISSSPHFSQKLSPRIIMAAVIFFLLPLCVNGVILFGIPALVTIIVSVASTVIFEALFQIVTKQKVRIGDLSAIVTGLMMALVLPPSIPIWMTIIGALFAVVVAKGFFGGIGQNVFNPALTGRAFLFISFPKILATWTEPFSSGVDAVSAATLLGQMHSGPVEVSAENYWNYFIGNRAGCIGESSILLILIAFIVLSILRVIDWRAPIAMIAVTALCTFLAGGQVLLSVMSGGLIFGAVFMATDYATTPVTPLGRVLFGVGCGLITFLIRKFGGYPEGVMFSILIMNIVTPFLNYIIPRKYGYIKKVKAPSQKDGGTK